MTTVLHGDRESFAAIAEDLSLAFDHALRPGVLEQYWSDLQRFHVDVVIEAAHEIRRTEKYFPKIATWLEACRRVASRRRQAAPPASESVSMTWNGAAAAILVQLRLVGADDVLRDEAVRDSVLAFIQSEIAAVLREEYGRPGDCPPDVWQAERKRIVSAALEQIRAGAFRATTTASPEARASST